MYPQLARWSGKPGIALHDPANNSTRNLAPAVIGDSGQQTAGTDSSNTNTTQPTTADQLTNTAQLTTTTWLTTTTQLTTTTTTTSTASSTATATVAARAAASASANTTTGTPATQAAPTIMALPNDKTSWVNALLHQQKTGVPPLHQCIIDQDFEMAAILLAAGADMGAAVLPPLNEKEAIDSDNRPAFTLVHATERKVFRDDTTDAVPANFPSASLNPALDLSTAQVVNFVLYAKSKAPQENLHFAGANALTLCLLCDAPADFLRKLCALAYAQQPSLLSSCDKQGRTPLTIAVAQGNTNTVLLLLEFKADPAGRDAHGAMPLDHALKHQHAEITRLLVRQGAADPTSTHRKLIGKEGDSGHEGYLKCAVSLLTALFEQQDLATLLEYQQQSPRHRAAVFKVLLLLCQQAVDTDSTAHRLKALLDFARPLLTTRRLAKIAMAIARHAGRQPELLAVLSRIGDEGFPKKRLPALRDAAGQSRDPAMLELAISVDQQLITLIGSQAKPSAARQARLNRLLALALQTGWNVLVDQLKKRGASLDLNDTALAGLPMVAILADHGDQTQLGLLVRAHATQGGPSVHLQVMAAIDAIKTGQGLLSLQLALKEDLTAGHLHQMLCHAVRLGDEQAAQALVRGGAEVDYLATCQMGLVRIDSGEATPLSVATETGNLPMLKLLVNLGAVIRHSDVMRAYRVDDALGRAVELMH